MDVPARRGGTLLYSCLNSERCKESVQRLPNRRPVLPQVLALNANPIVHGQQAVNQALLERLTNLEAVVNN